MESSNHVWDSYQKITFFNFTHHNMVSEKVEVFIYKYLMHVIENISLDLRLFKWFSDLELMLVVTFQPVQMDMLQS